MRTPGNLYKIKDKYYVRGPVCLFRIEGEDKVEYFDTQIPKMRRSGRATDSEFYLWNLLMIELDSCKCGGIGMDGLGNCSVCGKKVR